MRAGLQEHVLSGSNAVSSRRGPRIDDRDSATIAQRTTAPVPILRLAAVACALVFFGIAGTAVAQSSGTTLKITNTTSTPVPVQITLGNSSNPANQYGIQNISQLPASWGRLFPDPSAPTTQAIFILPGNASVSFNSGALSFAGNVAFGPTFTSRGCGTSTSVPNPCYPNSITLGEFALNLGASGSETVDISGVNGTNALIGIKFSGQGTGNRWNNGSFTGADQNVKIISNDSISNWNSPSGVYGWQATNCINVVPPVPNPMASCPAPRLAPASPQLQTNPQCNIQRGQGAPSGGTVEIVFKGYARHSGPQQGCAGAYAISPSSGKVSGSAASITGWGLQQVESITFQGAKATILIQTNDRLAFRTPACNFCNGQQPWFSNVVLNLKNGTSVILPATVAGPNAPAAWTYVNR
jgi:hypothetical protein